MNYGKFTFINVDEFIDLDRVCRISLKNKKHSFFWAFYLIDTPAEFVKSICFATTREASEWLKIKLNF